MAAETLQPFVCGGAAACFASTCIHPIDLAKVRLQLFSTLNPGAPKPSFPALLSGMVQKEGFMSIYAGLSAAIMRQAIYGTARIGLHRTFSDKLEKINGGDVPFYQKTLSGMLSGAIAVTIGTPFDVALVRMQADSMKPLAERNNYANVFDALARVAREEGFKSLYAGLAPNIGRGMSMNVGMLACYDQARQMICAVLGDDPKKPGLPAQLASSATAGFCAAAFSLPFDMLKSRMQDLKKSKPGGKPLPYSNLQECAMYIYRREGVLAFWTGFGAYYGRCAPHAMIILMSMESIKRSYRKAFNLDS
mmetsp:Transcript_30177/g.39756  ORF Transcript_30177/g.39756 Transcript_30177/m.39756 type:complete len:306 (+) Transcript_30177:210-1127(+)|eukprot:CAMPEP_0117767374 /NCGR_PEP_ID=MMETSP0947-20121206/21573_1 /TAXON_ID=44440 /ORGANISM="Chattonella subsalsa, Strain CCMP2191" /LENGTH=305 /DNA_ID=CAMNT_0005591015 /DNA_START=215 /DNA_END=1132 /DNA_ORIENTATION=+